MDIQRSQFGSGLKLKPKFLGPYKIVLKQRHGRYRVDKVGDSEGPYKTNRVADQMKPWTVVFRMVECRMAMPSIR